LMIRVEDNNGVTVVSSLPNFIDASNVMEFKAEIRAIIGTCPKVVFDMSTVKFIDSAGCGAFITSLRQLREAGGGLKLFALQKQVRSLFELVRMHKILDIYNNRQEALLSYYDTP
jgi:anti-sigma B factor antagonist